MSFSSQRAHRLTLAILFVVYAAVVIATTARHEVWRDEIRVQNYAVRTETTFEMLSLLGAEGHPGLWYVIQRAGHALYPHPEALKITHVAIALAAVAVFLWRAPFSLPIKLLFPFGLFPFYEYAAISRNYAISVLLIFVFASIYEARGRRFVLLGAVLFLLANTHLHAVVLVLAIALSLAYEQWRGFPEASPATTGGRLLGWALIVLGVVIAVVMAYPTHAAYGPRSEHFDGPTLVLSLFQALLAPGSDFRSALGVDSRVAASLFVWLVTLWTLRRPPIFLIFASATWGLAVFFELLHPGALRHQGTLIILIVLACWLDRLPGETIDSGPAPLRRFWDAATAWAQPVLVVVLLWQVWLGAQATVREWREPFSSSLAFAEFIRADPELDEAILVGARPLLIEPLLYYVDNRMYNPRSDAFLWTEAMPHEMRGELSLDHTIDSCVMLASRYRVPVLLALTYQLSPEGPFELRPRPGHVFRYSPQALERLHGLSRQVASFREPTIRGEEEYDIYRFEPPAGPSGAAY